MRSVALYAVTVLIWGTSWLAIIYQLGVVDPMVSVAYRFILAAVIMHGLCWVRRQPMRFSRRDHWFLALQGASLFALNYWLFYNAELHIASGLAAVVFSTIIVWNISSARRYCVKKPRPKKLSCSGCILKLTPTLKIHRIAVGNCCKLVIKLTSKL